MWPRTKPWGTPPFKSPEERVSRIRTKRGQENGGPENVPRTDVAAECGGTSRKTQFRSQPPGIPEGASTDWGGPGSRTEQVREETGTQQPTGGGKPNVREQTSGWTRSGPTLDCHSADKEGHPDACHNVAVDPGDVMPSETHRRTDPPVILPHEVPTTTPGRWGTPAPEKRKNA